MPPAASTVATVAQLVSVTLVGATTSAGTAAVPATFDASTVVVRPMESRMTMGAPGVATQVPLGVTTTPPPLAETTFEERVKAELVLDTA